MIEGGLRPVAVVVQIEQAHALGACLSCPEGVPPERTLFFRRVMFAAPWLNGSIDFTCCGLDRLFVWRSPCLA